MRMAKLDIKTKVNNDIWGNWATNIVYSASMHPISLDDLNEAEILTPHHHKQKSFAKRKRMQVEDYYNPVEAVLSQGCTECGEGGHNIRTCMYRENMDHI